MALWRRIWGGATPLNPTSQFSTAHPSGAAVLDETLTPSVTDVCKRDCGIWGAAFSGMPKLRKGAFVSNTSRSRREDGSRGSALPCGGGSRLSRGPNSKGNQGKPAAFQRRHEDRRQRDRSKGRSKGRSEGRFKGRFEGRFECRFECRFKGRSKDRFKGPFQRPFQGPFQRTVSKGRLEGRFEGRFNGRFEGRFEGRSKGRFKGRSKGRFEGRSKGRFEGRSQGRFEGRFEGRFNGPASWTQRRLAGTTFGPLDGPLERISVLGAAHPRRL
ncbi:hypothetical protein M885DRAFT_32868 [Pelagophyceae sp. CCMP2097]|nr:hypothetical protein M885DRAFT_32868 [Pelagophyceae sp. CCMP2097]